MQNASIILVETPAKKAALANIYWQDYVARMPPLLIFLTYCYRNNRIFEKRLEGISRTVIIWIFFQAFTYACLAGRNLTVVAESIELGTVYRGSILNDPDEIFRLFDFPKFTFPAVAIGFCYPTQNPPLTPQTAIDLRYFDDEYRILENYDDSFSEYDKIKQKLP